MQLDSSDSYCGSQCMMTQCNVNLQFLSCETFKELQQWAGKFPNPCYPDSYLYIEMRQVEFMRVQWLVRVLLFCVLWATDWKASLRWNQTQAVERAWEKKNNICHSYFCMPAALKCLLLHMSTTWEKVFSDKQGASGCFTSKPTFYIAVMV